MEQRFENRLLSEDRGRDLLILAQVLGRVLRVDHVKDYKPPKKGEEDHFADQFREGLITSRPRNDSGSTR